MTEKFPEFTKGEFQERWEQARRLMADAGLDGLLVTSECNYRYLSGHVTPFWVSKTRPFFFLLPLHRDPILFVTASQVTSVQATSWVEDIRPWEGFVPEGVDLLALTMRQVGLHRGRIGAELGLEQRLGLPYTDFLRLQSLLPQAVFVDAASLLWELRIIKSATEVDYLRRAASITSRAYREVLDSVQEGMGEREIFAAFVMSTFRQGAERQGYVPVHSGDGNYNRHATGPSDRTLRRGDILWMDGGCVYRGYWSDFARMVAVGQASDIQRRHYRTVRAVMHKCLQAVQPGVAMGDLTRLAMKEFEAAGIELNAHSRIGHGMGLDITEPPSINLTDPTIIRANMVLTIEPTSATDFGFFQLEENFVVTEDGCDPLNEAAPEELPITKEQ